MIICSPYPPVNVDIDITINAATDGGRSFDGK
jgi:hypothetical protein